MAAAIVLMMSAAQAETTAQTQSIGYAVSAVLPANQLRDSTGYFDLLLAPRQEQVLQVKILNREAEEIMVAVEANAAFTNQHGVIAFAGEPNAERFGAVDFLEIVTVIDPLKTEGLAGEYAPEQPLTNAGEMAEAIHTAEGNGDTVVLKVPAMGETVAEFAVTAPEEPFAGAVFGGLVFTRLDQAQADDAGGMAIRNIYRYAIGVRLQMSQETVLPDFSLAGASLTQTGTQTLTLRLNNLQPLIAHNITLRGAIVSAQGESLYEFERGNISMAPNTAMDYEVILDGLTLPESDPYSVSMTLEYAGMVWQFQQPIHIV